MEGTSLSSDGCCVPSGAPGRRGPHVDGCSPGIAGRYPDFPPQDGQRLSLKTGRSNPTTLARQTFQEVALQEFQMNYSIIEKYMFGYENKPI